MDTIDFQIHANGDIDRIVVASIGRDSLIYSLDTLATLMTNSLVIPQYLFGEAGIIAIGYDQEGLIDFDTLDFFIDFQASLDSIAVEPDELILAKNRTGSIRVFGYYNDGVKRNISNHSQVSIEIIDSTVAARIEHTNVIEGLKIDTTSLIVGFGIFSTSIPVDVFEGVQITSPATSVERFQKDMNINLEVYPNPFAVKTMVSFTLDKSQQTTLQIFDFTGKLVRNIWLKELKQSGQHHHLLENVFLGKGIYIIRLVTENGVYFRKILAVM